MIKARTKTSVGTRAIEYQQLSSASSVREQVARPPSPHALPPRAATVARQQPTARKGTNPFSGTCSRTDELCKAPLLEVRACLHAAALKIVENQCSRPNPSTSFLYRPAAAAMVNDRLAFALLPICTSVDL
eukprot:2668516-Pleurochrysis_carterae.AAC.1